MTRILPFLALTLLLGCSSADDMPGYKKQSGDERGVKGEEFLHANLPGLTKQSGDLGAFILQQSSKFGARARQTNGLPQFTANWHYKEESNGFEIYLVGDHFAQLQSFLTAAFGPPAQPPMTREVAGTTDIATHYDPAQLGSFLHYGSKMTRDGKQFTSMVVIRAYDLK